MISRSVLPLIIFLAACAERGDSREQIPAKPSSDGAGAAAMRTEPPWTPEGVECIIGSRSLGEDGFQRGAQYDEWSCDWMGERRYLFTPCSSDQQCGEGGHCNTERGRCGARTTCLQTDVLQPNAFDPNRWNCELSNGAHGICLSRDNCVPLCKTDLDCPGVPCFAIGAYRLCKIL